MKLTSRFVKTAVVSCAVLACLISTVTLAGKDKDKATDAAAGGAGGGGGSTCTPCSDLDRRAVCKSKYTGADGKQRVSVDLTKIKNGATISWICARDSGAALESCGGNDAGSKNKCEETTSATYTVAGDATSVTVQVHDGKIAGDVQCSSVGMGAGQCCGGSGGSCGTVSGVCEYSIDITSCPLVTSAAPATSATPAECSADSDCSARTINEPCGVYTCSSAGKCVQSSVKPATVVCRAAAGVCDVDDFCDGVSSSCVADAKRPATFVCRASAGACDVDDFCDGDSAACTEDAKRPATHVCRASAGACDVDDFCDGESAACTVDVKRPATHVCRASAGVCDVADSCDGTSNACPLDAKKPAGTICRAAGSCDYSAEACDGQSNECPVDVRHDHSWTYKCATTCYSCGYINPHTRTGATWQAGDGMYVGSTAAGAECNNARCDKLVQLPYPACLSTCPDLDPCPEGNSMSHWIDLSCNVATDVTSCQWEKQTSGGGKICPSWAAVYGIELTGGMVHTSGRLAAMQSDDEAKTAVRADIAAALGINAAEVNLVSFDRDTVSAAPAVVIKAAFTTSSTKSSQDIKTTLSAVSAFPKTSTASGIAFSSAAMTVAAAGSEGHVLAVSGSAANAMPAPVSSSLASSASSCGTGCIAGVACGSIIAVAAIAGLIVRSRRALTASSTTATITHHAMDIAADANSDDNDDNGADPSRNSAVAVSIDDGAHDNWKEEEEGFDMEALSNAVQRVKAAEATI